MLAWPLIYGLARGFMKDRLTSWRGLEDLTLADAALLMIEKYPDDYSDGLKLLNEPPNDFIPIYKQLLKSASTPNDEFAISDDYKHDDFTIYQLRTDKSKHIGKLSLEDGLFVTTTPKRLKKWLASKERRARFFDDDTLTSFEASKEVKPTSHSNVSEQLSYLNQASSKYWENADPSNRGTHPLNSTVAAFLVKRGFSATLADSGATIIRPEWAPTGRKADE